MPLPAPPDAYVAKSLSLSSESLLTVSCWVCSPIQPICLLVLSIWWYSKKNIIKHRNHLYNCEYRERSNRLRLEGDQLMPGPNYLPVTVATHFIFQNSFQQFNVKRVQKYGIAYFWSLEHLGTAWFQMFQAIKNFQQQQLEKKWNPRTRMLTRRTPGLNTLI